MTAETIHSQVLKALPGLSEESQNCANCKHFIQHFVLAGIYPNQFVPCCSGTCSYPRIKRRKVYDTCVNFAHRNGEGRQ